MNYLERYEELEKQVEETLNKIIQIHGEDCDKCDDKVINISDLDLLNEGEYIDKLSCFYMYNVNGVYLEDPLSLKDKCKIIEYMFSLGNYI